MKAKRRVVRRDSSIRRNAYIARAALGIKLSGQAALAIQLKWNASIDLLYAAQRDDRSPMAARTRRFQAATVGVTRMAAPVPARSSVLGHTEIRTTSNYARVLDDTKRGAIEARTGARGPAGTTQFNGDVMRVNRLSNEPDHDSDGVLFSVVSRTASNCYHASRATPWASTGYSR
jgi:hypothetical protein